MAGQKSPYLERRIQTLIGAIVLTLLIWVFTSVQQLEVIVGKQSVHIETLIKTTDAVRNLESKVNGNTIRIEKIEGR